ncbi:MAG TPA: hypothetical protein VLH38_03260 [Patescibacteria group bacterium]|nr:hypothetical protein [Patescibacteria group bacterium]
MSAHEKSANYKAAAYADLPTLGWSNMLKPQSTWSRICSFGRTVWSFVNFLQPIMKEPFATALARLFLKEADKLIKSDEGSDTTPHPS